MSATRCGFVALAGRPNVGKSTLMNHLLGRKLSITSRKPQTTRHNLLGIDTRGDTQFVYLDTPGMHRPVGASETRPRAGRAINRYMVGQAVRAVFDADVVVLLVEARPWTDADAEALEQIARARTPCVCAINKVDRLRDRRALLPIIDDVRRRHGFEAIVPISALRGEALGALADEVAARLPEGPHLFGSDDVTDRPTEFFLAEIIREKIMRRLGDEVPHRVAVGIERFAGPPELAEVDAVIYVERGTQKGIVIGKGGARLKSIGQDARRDIERLLGRRAMVRLWVKVKAGWTNDEAVLRTLGYR
ncbi:MAG: GTPase Era [Gammaproteobacteria bacterium]|nr:GTPase Era [Gammaproteobacteria bacterium]